MTAPGYSADRVINKNADNAVTQALVHGIYTMLVTASSVTDSAVTDMMESCRLSMYRHGTTDLTVVAKQVKAKIVPRGKIAIIVYNKNARNPYLDYGFRHRTIIIRIGRRRTEQTIQLIEHARKLRPDLDDMIVHTCVTQQHGTRKYLIIICRGKDEYKRAIFKGGKKVPVHEKPVPTERAGMPRDKYMLKSLERYGNTVVDLRFIERMGMQKTQQWLTKHFGEPVHVREVPDPGHKPYYIAETDDISRRHNE